MELRKWKNAYKQGIERLDTHHQKFHEIINAIAELDHEKSKEDKISLIFFKLMFYVENHFIDEENFMQEHNYPDFASHKEKHNVFIREVIKFQEEYQNGDKTVVERLYTSLTAWFDNHILVDDKVFADFLIKKGIS